MKCAYLALFVSLATPAWADQAIEMQRMLHDPNHVGAAIPTGYQVDDRPIAHYKRKRHVLVEEQEERRRKHHAYDKDEPRRHKHEASDEHEPRGYSWERYVDLIASNSDPASRPQMCDVIVKARENGNVPEEQYRRAMRVCTKR
jgi:hypothetical protein